MRATALKVSLIMLPLTYAVFLLIMTGNVNAILGTLWLSFIISAVTTAVLAGIQVFGTGLNASATLIAFILIFGAGFYGIAVAGPNIGHGIPVKFGAPFAGDLVHTPEPSIPGTVVQSQGVSGIDYPYKGIVDIILACMYGIGLFLLVADRGGD